MDAKPTCPECLGGSVLTDTYAKLRWWRIARPNGTPSYGYGTEAEARTLANLWSAALGLDVDRYQVEPEDDYDEARRDDGFNLAEEIDDAR